MSNDVALMLPNNIPRAKIDDYVPIIHMNLFKMSDQLTRYMCPDTMRPLFVYKGIAYQLETFYDIKALGADGYRRAVGEIRTPIKMPELD